MRTDERNKEALWTKGGRNQRHASKPTMTVMAITVMTMQRDNLFSTSTTLIKCIQSFRPEHQAPLIRTANGSPVKIDHGKSLGNF